MSDIKRKVENCIIDLVAEFFYYGRKDDEDLSVDALEDAINRGTVTKEEIIEIFSREVTDAVDGEATDE